MALQQILICNPYTKKINEYIDECQLELHTLNTKIALLREAILKQNSDTFDALERQPYSDVLHQLTVLKKITYSPLMQILEEGLESLEKMKIGFNLLLNDMEKKCCKIKKKNLANLVNLSVFIFTFISIIRFVFFKEEVNKWINTLFGAVISPSIFLLTYTMMNKLYNPEQQIDKTKTYLIDIDCIYKSIQTKLEELKNRNPIDTFSSAILTEESLNSLAAKQYSSSNPTQSSFNITTLSIDPRRITTTANPSVTLEKEMGKWYTTLIQLEHRAGVLKEKMSETVESLKPNPSSGHFETSETHNTPPQTPPKTPLRRAATLSWDAASPATPTYYYT